MASISTVRSPRRGIRFEPARLLVCLLLISLAPLPLWAAEYHVAPNGSDASAGTESAPFASLSKANDTARAGDTIWVHGGTYLIKTQLVLSKGGTSDQNRTKIWAYPGETPILDASQYVTSNAAVDVPVVLVTGSWMHLRGLEIGNAKVGANGDHSYSLLRTKNASNNIFELLDLHHGFGPGLFIDTGNGGNQILDCDSHDNYDKNGSQGDGQNGDGFGVHYQTSGPSTVIRGCRAWMNSDDGYDYIYQEVPVLTEHNFAAENGYGSDGNGNGFKMGSSGTGIRHVVANNVAWNNKASGFYANHSSGGNDWYNNSSYQNGTQYNMLAATFESDGRTIQTDGVTLSGNKAHVMRNNVGYPNKNANMNGVDSQFNSWDLNLSEAGAAFVSTDPAGCLDPREADGSFPASCEFLQLTSQSALIDTGSDVGLSYVGDAPDLGAYEFGAIESGTGSGGDSSMASGGADQMGSGGGAAQGSGATSSGGGGLPGDSGSGGAGTAEAGGGSSGGSAQDGDPGASSGGSATDGSTGGQDSETADGGDLSGDQAGCSCRSAGPSRPARSGGALLVALLGLIRVRRRPRTWLSSFAVSASSRR